jgi:hypothetical protein
MAITPGYSSTNDATEVDQEYIDKGAVTTPQYNPSVDAKYAAGKAQALATDKVEWPTKVAGLTN